MLVQQQAAARYIKRRFNVRLIIALPVASKDTVKLLKQEADVVEVVTSPSANFARSRTILS